MLVGPRTLTGPGTPAQWVRCRGLNGAGGRWEQGKGRGIRAVRRVGKKIDQVQEHVPSPFVIITYHVPCTIWNHHLLPEPNFPSRVNKDLHQLVQVQVVHSCLAQAAGNPQWDAMEPVPTICIAI